MQPEVKKKTGIMAANSAGGWRGKKPTTYTRENTKRIERVRKNKKNAKERILVKKQWLEGEKEGKVRHQTKF